MHSRDSLSQTLGSLRSCPSIKEMFGAPWPRDTLAAVPCPPPCPLLRWCGPVAHVGAEGSQAVAPSSRLHGKAKMLTFISCSLVGNLPLCVTSEILAQPGNADSLSLWGAHGSLCLSAMGGGRKYEPLKYISPRCRGRTLVWRGL